MTVSLFEISYVALWALLVWQSVVLGRMIFQTANMDREYRNGPSAKQKLPKIRAEIVGSTEILKNSNLREKSTAILFAGSACSTAFPAREYRALVISLMSKVDGALYLVCDGAQEPNDAERLRQACELDEAKRRLRVISDPKGKLSRRLGIREKPSGITIDENGNVIKVGVFSYERRSE